MHVLEKNIKKLLFTGFQEDYQIIYVAESTTDISTELLLN
jgi:hypothetical protein